MRWNAAGETAWSITVFHFGRIDLTRARGAGSGSTASARRHRDRLHEIVHHVLPDLVTHVLADFGREAVVEAGPDARLRDLVATYDIAK